MMENKIDLFLDSGAFSAWSQGIEVNIHDYIAFVKEHEDILTVYANLDVIGSAEGTFQNQKIMEAAGLNPLPVFHVGEPWDYLQRYIDNYDYVALGGMVGRPKPTLVPWLNQCFSKYICDDAGYPKAKIHGFGLTSLSLMLQYPWYSVDSTSWIMTSRMGSIYVPRYRNGEWIYDENSWKISVSSRSPGKSDDPDHIDNLAPRLRKTILDYVHMKGYTLGSSSFKITPPGYELQEGELWAEKKPKDKTASRRVEIIEEEGICNKYQLRDEMNIRYFMDLEQSMPEWPWAFKLRGVQGFSL